MHGRAGCRDLFFEELDLFSELHDFFGVGLVPRQAAEGKRTIGSLVQELLMDETLGYEVILEQVKAQFPAAKTSVRSIASVAANLRKRSVDVPMRRKKKD